MPQSRTQTTELAELETSKAAEVLNNHRARAAGKGAKSQGKGATNLHRNGPKVPPPEGTAQEKGGGTLRQLAAETSNQVLPCLGKTRGCLSPYRRSVLLVSVRCTRWAESSPAYPAQLIRNTRFLILQNESWEVASLFAFPGLLLHLNYALASTSELRAQPDTKTNEETQKGQTRNKSSARAHRGGGASAPGAVPPTCAREPQEPRSRGQSAALRTGSGAQGAGPAANSRRAALTRRRGDAAALGGTCPLRGGDRRESGQRACVAAGAWG